MLGGFLRGQRAGGWSVLFLPRFVSGGCCPTGLRGFCSAMFSGGDGGYNNTTTRPAYGREVSMPYGRLPHITIAGSIPAIIYIYIYIYMYVSFVLFHYCHRCLLACTTLWRVLRNRFFGSVYCICVFMCLVCAGQCMQGRFCRVRCLRFDPSLARSSSAC